MTKNQIIETLRTELPELKNKFGIESIGLFGSYAKDSNDVESDIDIFVEMDPDFNRFMGLLIYLEKKMSSKIDLIRKGPHLSKKFLDNISNELIYA